eukprot:CAMPEP_0203820742 /NCGR_PEP_ID=MMETSP0115-20131106/40899_1 /ASSEMBLY_ACC=CAM_ASM_000227 /TAXON_ID=33651 /ORGANISM="Bicosoecid sp, Strain ms1" /LENGTH=70 /DNA_ID=CAMNT_0050729759 /DNA_START=53 /DNA_END=261 /DNA_ORIENTATION=-
MTCIIANIFVMALNSPVETDATLLDVLDAFEWVFSVVFTVEMLMRIVALEGLSPYLADAWNALDCIIVIG